MFNTLESNWDQSARRGRATLASFAMQVFGISILLAIPLLTAHKPPRLTWIERSPILVPRAAAHEPAPRQPINRTTNLNTSDQIVAPPTIPDTIARLDERAIQSAPDLPPGGVEGGSRDGARGVDKSIGDSPAAAPPQVHTAPARPVIVSHWAEGNLIFRVQPAYPTLAKQARIQGTVELRAIISRTGTIENLTVLSGHPMLVKAALDAVRQWRYRPYLLNGDPVEVETSVTVNFVLSGN